MDLTYINTYIHGFSALWTAGYIMININHKPPVLPGDPSASQVKRLRLVPVPGTPSRRSPISRRTPSSSGRRFRRGKWRIDPAKQGFSSK